MFPNYSMYTSLQGISDRRASAGGLIPLTEKVVPHGFPLPTWNAQAQRYWEYWMWFTGDMLNEPRNKPKENEKPILKYPLGINPIRNFSRKHAATLMGEENFDTALPLVRTKVTPRDPLDLTSLESTERHSEDDKKLSILAQNIVNTVWSDSNGRALQMENAVLTQFLGGCVFQVSWQPWRKDELQIPIVVKAWPADFFLPIWAADDPWDLLSAFLIYRVPVSVAREMYNYKGADTHSTGFVIYCESWTKTHYSITINGTPLTSSFAGQTVTYDKVENPFGFVPFVYIPHVREGNFFGSSIVEDLRGLTRELNARAADMGDAIRDTVHRRRYSRDITGKPAPRQLDKNTWAIDIGTTSLSTKEKPDVFTEDPPSIPEGLTTFSSSLWSQLLREGNMGDIAFGEDEGSQRSALTLAFRMWPTTAHARAERTFWTDGLNTIAKYILRIYANKIDPKSIPSDFGRKLNFSQDWLPQIPRDREQMVNEVILRFQAGMLSLSRAIDMLGDVEYVQEEVEAIKEWLKFQASLGKPIEIKGNTAGTGAKTMTQDPVATSGLSAND